MKKLSPNKTNVITSNIEKVKTDYPYWEIIISEPDPQIVSINASVSLQETKIYRANIETYIIDHEKYKIAVDDIIQKIIDCKVNKEVVKYENTIHLLQKKYQDEIDKSIWTKIKEKIFKSKK